MDRLEQNDSARAEDWGARLRSLYVRGRLLALRWWWIVALFTAAGVLHQVFTQLMAEPVYLSNARMIVSGMVDLPDGNAYREEYANFFGTQLELMQSARVRERAVLRVRMLHPDLAPVPVSMLARQQPDTTIFLLSARGSSGPYVQAWLDSVIEEYLNLRKEMRTQTSETAVLAVTEQLVKLQQDIGDWENALVDFQRQNNLVYIQEQGSTAGQYLARLKNQQADLRTQLRMIEALGLSSQIDSAPVEQSSREMLEISPVQISPAYIEARDELDRLEARLREFSTYLKPKHPKIIALSSEIERTRNLLKIYEEDALASLDERKRILKAKIENLDVVIADWEAKALENSRKAAEYDRLQSRLERARETYQRLLSSTETLNLSKDLELDAVTVLEPATQPWREKRSFVGSLAQGGFKGMALGLALIVALGVLDQRIINAEDLRRRFELPVLAVIPLERHAGRKNLDLLQLKDPRHLFAEACRTLRSSLLFLRTPQEQPLRSIALTSAIPEEGKSTLSVNLAIALSFTASRTVLVDADLRRGRLHRQLDLKDAPGMGDLLAGKADVDSVIQRTGFDSLDVITSGNSGERPGELLLGHRMDSLLHELRKRYDFVIIDTAPILAADDTTGFAAKTDAVLFVVRSASAQPGQVKASLDRLQSRGVNVPGFVLNCVDTRGADYYYYRKYHNYYSREPEGAGKA